MNKLNDLLKWVSARLSERSSWLGIIALVTSLGLTLSPELQDIIIQLGISLAGLVSFFTKDKAQQ